MQTVKRTAPSVVSEAALENRLIETLKRFGAHGYIIVEARGAGARGARTAEDDQGRRRDYCA